MTSARSLPLVLALALLTAGALGADEDRPDRVTSVASAVGVVVHGVDTGSIAGLLQTMDEAAAEERWGAVAAGLDALLAGELTVLVEETEGIYLRAHEAAVWRLATLPRAGLAAWRAIADARAAALLAAVDRAGSREVLERQARRLALSSHGPALVVVLADQRLRDGDLRGAARLLEELLILWPAGEPDSGPDDASLAGLGRATVVSRLAAIHAAIGDAASIRTLGDELPAAVLAAVSPRGTPLSEELVVAEAAARARRHVSTPTGALRELAFLPIGDRRGIGPSDLADTREIVGTGAATRHAGVPLFLVRDLDSVRGTARLRAVTRGASTPERDGPAPLETLWTWPSDEELLTRPRTPAAAPFAPAFIDDLAIFCWPSSREFPDGDDDGRFATDTAPQDLVALSLDAEGRLEDVRGPEEERREDGDEELTRLSFAGPPLLVDRSLYVTLVGHAPNGRGTELHLARFDVGRPGSRSRLRLRWRHHLVDGHSVPPQLYQASLRPDLESPLALPTGLAERLGYVYVGTNTGAVVCVDGATGQPVWAETYERLGTRRARPVIEGHPSGWKHGPVIVDGARVVVAPRDAELLLVFAALPLRERSARRRKIRVRGGGTATRAGTPLGDLLADELAGVRDGVVWITGRLPTRRGDAIRWPPGPLVAYRERRARDGEPARPLSVPEIPELAAAGRPAIAGESLYLPTFKALYRVSLADPEAPPETLYRVAVEPGQRTYPDRIGNLVPDGRYLWSVTPSRLVLFGPADD